MNRLVFLVLASVASVAVVASSFGATDLTYQYDLNGNLVSDGGKWYEYDDANQLVKVRHGASNGPVIAEYFYDHQGQRIKKIENGVVTYYVGKHYETQVAQGVTKSTSYYFANGERVARKDPSGNMSFYHSDHLGGTNVMTDAAGTLVSRTRYYPFGEIREGGSEKYAYTGKEKDSFTNFYYYEARYYAPALEHFTQADTAEPDLYDPQSLNKYAYARNNPLRFIDPTGQSWLDKVLDISKTVTESAAQLFSKLRDSFSLSHAGDVTERIAVYANKSLTILDIGLKINDSVNFSTAKTAEGRPSIASDQAQLRQAQTKLRHMENLGSALLGNLPSGGSMVGKAGAGMLGTHNLSTRDAPRMIIDAQKPRNLIDVWDRYDRGEASEQELERAMELYNNPSSNPDWPR